MDSKGSKFRHLIARMDRAYAEGFAFEVIFLAYGVIEDRLSAALRHSGRTCSGSMHSKLQSLGDALGDDPRLAAALTPALDEISIWKRTRNALVHRIVECDPTAEGIFTQAESCAADGVRLARRVADGVTRYRKFIKKARTTGAGRDPSGT